MNPVPRRGFIQSGLAIALATSLNGLSRAQSNPMQAATAPRGPIDVHHHLFPPAMVEALRSRLPEFVLPGVERSLAELNGSGARAAMISFPNSDIVELPEQQLTTLIRKSNDYAAELVAKNPGRYGLFASLPMPYVEASLKELSRALDELHADGILLITNYRNRWLGDPLFAPVLAELNRRQAVVYTHPNAADCCKGLIPKLSDAIIEFLTDLTREAEKASL